MHGRVHGLGHADELQPAPCYEDLQMNWDLRTNHHSSSSNHHNQREIICWAVGDRVMGGSPSGLWIEGAGGNGPSVEAGRRSGVVGGGVTYHETGATGYSRRT